MMRTNEILETNREAWNTHYDRSRAALDFPDENLVRLLQSQPRGPALDYGCGSGRHIKLLLDLRFHPVYATDTSDRALDMCRERFGSTGSAQIIRLPHSGAQLQIPVGDAAFQTIVCWGVLHYNSPEDTDKMLAEFRRILKPGGVLLGTLRATGDTHFQSNSDMDGARIFFYNEDEARRTLNNHFTDTRLGYMERTPIGDLSRRVCHWFFEARKP